MMGMKIFANAISLYRTYSTKKSINDVSNGIAEKIYRRVGKYKKNIPKTPNRKTRNRKTLKWTDEQINVLNHVSSGHSVFITGSAGTGKTVLVKQIIKILKKTHKRSQVCVTASTGIAACAIHGQTLHSFAGIGLGQGDKDMLVDQVLNNKKAYRRWIDLETLVIDEISLIKADLFDKLEHIAKTVRESNQAWGGIRLIACGDFFQLPPILTKNDSFCKQFAFEADCWDQSFDVQLELTRIFRQSDERLIKILQGIRKGKSDPEDLHFLEQLCSESEPDPSVLRLYPRTYDASKVNEERMKALSKKKFVYEAVDESKTPWKRFDFGLAPDKIELCEGARVMLIKNLHVWRGLVNGATGTVTGFTRAEGGSALNPDNPLPVLKFDQGPEIVIKPKLFHVMEGSTSVASRLQLPLVYAWAMTIHKCQGMTLDRVHTDLSRAFGCGMVYVALSRVRSLDGLHLSGFSPSKIEAHPKVLKFYNAFACKQETEDGNVATNKRNGQLLGSKKASLSDRTSDDKPGFKFSLKEFISRFKW